MDTDSVVFGCRGGDDGVLLETVLLELVEIKRGSGIMPHIPCR